MGVLKHQATGRRVTLAARSLVGRAEGCAVRLTSRRASGEHAVLFWDGDRWSTRDLGSRNGTAVEGRRVATTERVVLAPGAELCFGDDAERWTLEDAGPPTASALAAATGEVRTAEHGLLVLPDAADPRVTLFEDRDGCWLIELDGDVRSAMDHERVEAEGPWVLRVPPPAQGGAVPTTHAADSVMLMNDTVLRFEVSRDEEHVALSILHGGQLTSLSGRTHHELLLVLARARLRDKENGAPAAEQGWVYVDDLLHMLKLDLKHLNVKLFRARQQLAQAGLIEVGALVERRQMTRQIRLGTAAVEVIRH
ncbi:FHA domain-containing protein [Sorangium sp. So ce1182]|uniref:FHA domain-containing protein n=1 Tax=Sorangium sp. So ce1182 TaxID=3133334 RepID=UPI003F5DE738